MNLKDKRVLVTGADGFIGSHLVEHLLELGVDVRAFVFYNSFNSWGWLDRSPDRVTKELDVFAGDIRDSYGVRKAVAGCDVVLHLAALIGIPYSYHSPDTYVDTNVHGTLNVLQAARDLGVERVVHTSTSEVYGSAQFVPITEEHPLHPQSPYAATKVAADQMALAFHHSFATPVSIVRPFNTFGPRQSARAVIPTVIIQVLRGRERIALGNMTATRDYNYVSDTVRGFVRVAESERAVGEVINIGSGHEFSVAAMTNMVGELTGRSVEIEVQSERLRPEGSEVDRLVACNSKALELAGWRPEYQGEQGFREALAATIDWFKDPDNLSSYKWQSYQI